jgi:hypothetical protein
VDISRGRVYCIDMSGIDRQQNIDAFVERRYEQIVAYGNEALAVNPLVTLEAPGKGGAYWPQRPDALQGYEVSTISFGATEPQASRAAAATMGFSGDMMTEGIWSLRAVSVQYDPVLQQWLPAGQTAHTYAHYNPVSAQWTLRSWDQTVPPGEGGPESWLEPETGLTPLEKAILARIADETDLIAEAAFAFRNELLAYDALAATLAARARRSGNANESRAIGALLLPVLKMPALLGGSFDPSGISRIDTLAPALYRAQAGLPQQDTAGIEAVAILADTPHGIPNECSPMKPTTLYPSYEPTDFPLSRDNLPTLRIESA